MKPRLFPFQGSRAATAGRGAFPPLGGPSRSPNSQRPASRAPRRRAGDGGIEGWFEAPGLCDNHPQDPYRDRPPDGPPTLLERAGHEPVRSGETSSGKAPRSP